jgi:hypothetical protein
MQANFPLFRTLFLPQPFLIEKLLYCHAGTRDLHILSVERGMSLIRAE